MNLQDYGTAAHKTARDHGFWDGYSELNRDTMLIKMALVTSEIGEAVEALRHDNWSGFTEELADIVIRVFDISEALGIDLESIIIKKMHYNSTRPHMHGKKA
jgi:NTP pyrophosphatase (non-canonical NTP hydrolase)